MRDLLALMRLFKPMHARLAASALIGAVAYLASIGLIAVSGWLISRASQMPPVLTLSVAIVMVRAFGIGRSVFRYCERLVSHDAVLQSLVELRIRLYESLADAPAWSVMRMRRADALTTLVRDVDEVQYIPLRALVPATGASIAAIGCIAVEFTLDFGAGLWVLAGWLVAAIALPWLAWATSRGTVTSTAVDSADMAAVCIDLIDASADIATLGLSGQAMASAKSVDARLTETSMQFTSRAAASNGLLLLTQGLMVVGAGWAAVRSISAGDLDAVLMATVVFIPLAMTEVLAVYSNSALTLATTQPSVQRLASALRGDDVGGWQAAEETRAPRNIEVAPLERVGVIGSSGSGKSTLLASLAGMLPLPSDASDGIAGLPSAAAGERVRLRVALAEQDAHVFATSIAENLQVARPVGDEALSDGQLWAALAAVNLDQWVRGLPAGLDAFVGVGGAKMSGGQRQRLSVARLFIADPDLWLLDEPTAHVDAENARRLLDAVRSATSHRTVVIASHDDRDLVGCDRVVDLDR